MEGLRAFEKRLLTRDETERKYRKGTILQGGKDPSAVNESGELIGRGVEEYCRRLGLEVDNLKSKIVVDLGAGITGRFARELQDMDPDTRVYSVSPDYSEDKYRAGMEDLEGVITATADDLPLEDNSVDYVVSMWMLTHVVDGVIIPSHDQTEARLGDLKQIVHEASRVLKEGGVFALYPVVLGRYETDKPLDMDGLESVVEEDTFLSALRHELAEVEHVQVELIDQHGEFDEEDNLEAVILIARIKFIK